MLGIGVFEFIILILLAAFLVSRFVSSSTKKGEAIFDYFCDATLVFGASGEEASRLAALAAAKTADKRMRERMIEHVRFLRKGMAANDAGGPTILLAVIEGGIRDRDWTLDDVREAKAELRAASQQYANSLDKSDSTVFRREHPDLFS